MMAAASSCNIARLVNSCDDPTLVGTLLSELPGSPTPCEENAPVEWGVENKYYTASIQLHRHCWTEEWKEGMAACDAVVIICNIVSAEGMQRVQQCWTKMTADGATPDVCLLVAVTTNSSNHEMEEDAVKWCADRGFELVRWTPGSTLHQGEKEENGEEDEEEEEEEGIARLSVALQAHVWPDIKMKESEPTVGLTMTSESSAPVDSKCDSTDKLDDLSAEQLLARGLEGEGEGDGTESFEELFGRFAAMKAHAESLPHEQRKRYAEQVVKSFWQAIGGDEEEMADSDSDTGQ